MDDDRETTLSEFETERYEMAEEFSARRVSLVLYHRDGTKVVVLAKDTEVVVGRTWPADAVIRDIKLSRRHASFILDDEGVTVEDLGSTNGTYLNGERIAEPKRLVAEDEVRMGAVAASLHVLSPREEASHKAESFDRFTSRLEEEVVRTRTFGRPLSLLMVSSVGAGETSHARHFLPHLRAHLRPVDLVGLYGPQHLAVALPETSLEEAARLARKVTVRGALGVPDLVAGIASLPDTAVSAEELIAVAGEGVRRASLDEPVQGLAPASADGGVPTIVVVDPAMRQLFETVGRVARSNAPILIVGETGTGKELVARAVHDESTRKEAPLRAVNCAALPDTLIESTLFGHERGAFTGADSQRPGLFEQADGGTVFLDEVGELSKAAQAALLRVLETKRLSRVGSTEEIEVDVRVVAATHRDLETMSDQGVFRQDLLYRLNAITLEVPPLRARRTDIRPLAELFASEALRGADIPTRSIDDGAMLALEHYRWPGNVRELRNAIERAAVIAEGLVITVEDLPRKVVGGGDLAGGPGEVVDSSIEFKDRVRQYEVDLIVDALKKTGGNQTQAAKLLRMPLRTLVHKIKTYGIERTYSP